MGEINMKNRTRAYRELMRALSTAFFNYPYGTPPAGITPGQNGWPEEWRVVPGDGWDGTTPLWQTNPLFFTYPDPNNPGQNICCGQMQNPFAKPVAKPSVPTPPPSGSPPLAPPAPTQVSPTQTNPEGGSGEGPVINRYCDEKDPNNFALPEGVEMPTGPATFECNGAFVWIDPPNVWVKIGDTIYFFSYNEGKKWYPGLGYMWMCWEDIIRLSQLFEMPVEFWANGNFRMPLAGEWGCLTTVDPNSPPVYLTPSPTLEEVSTREDLLRWVNGPDNQPQM